MLKGKERSNKERKWISSKNNNIMRKNKRKEADLTLGRELSLIVKWIPPLMSVMQMSLEWDRLWSQGKQILLSQGVWTIKKWFECIKVKCLNSVLINNFYDKWLLYLHHYTLISFIIKILHLNISWSQEWSHFINRLLFAYY